MNRVSGAPAGLAADARGLAALKYDAARNDPAAVREAAKQLCKQRYLEFGCEGQAGKITSHSLFAVAAQYARGELAQVVH